MSLKRVIARVVAGRSGLLMALSALAVAGCSVMSSGPVIEGGRTLNGCSSSLGSYVLPRRVLKIKILRNGDDFELADLGDAPVPDNAHNYCLEHDSNPFAEDSVRVYRNKIVQQKPETTPPTWIPATEQRTPYLQLIASRAIDHSAAIVRTFIRAAFIAISNNPDFGRAAINKEETGKPVVADHQVDPFNYHEMAQLNQAIRRFGFCVVLSGYTFNEAKRDASAYCDAPEEQARRDPPPRHKAIKSMRWHVPKPAAGIFYRPRAPYNVEVYIKHRPDDKGQWELALIKTVQMENIMPVVSVGVDRALFAVRRTGLIFNDGELVDVCVSRGNSVTGATNIVLDVVYGIISLPSATIEAAISDANTKQQLTAKRLELIKAQEDYIKFLQGEEKVSTVSGKTASRLKLNEPAARPTGAALPTHTSISDSADADQILLSSDALNEICTKLQAAENPVTAIGTAVDF